MGDTTRIECELNARTRRYRNLVATTEGRVIQVCNGKNVAVSWSTGKDSTVMVIMLLLLWIKCKIVTIDWGKHRPDSYTLVELYKDKYGIDHEYLYPEYDMEWIKNYEWLLHNKDDQGYVNKHWFMSNYVREPISKFVQKNKVDVQIVGLRNAESRGRWIRWRYYGDMVNHAKTWVSTFRPLNKWKSLDIRTYIIMSWVEYNTIYDKMQETYGGKIYDHRCAEYFANATLRGQWPVLLEKYYPDIYEKEKSLFPNI